MSETIKTRGIVFKNIRYGDKNLISDIFTESYGRLSFFIYGGNTKKKRNIYLPLNVVEIVFQLDIKRDLQKIKESYNVLNLTYHYEVKKTPVIFLISELLSDIVKSEEIDKSFFNFLIKSLVYYDKLEKINSFFSQFLVFLSYNLGIMAVPENDIKYSYYDFEENTFLQYSPMNNFYLNEKQTDFIITLLKKYEYNVDIVLPLNDRIDLIEKFLKYITIRFGIKKLNSYELFRRVL